MDHTNPLDTIVDRRNSDSVKYGAGNRSPEKEKLLPLWVADMGFRVPEPVIGSAPSPDRTRNFRIRRAGSRLLRRCLQLVPESL